MIVNLQRLTPEVIIVGTGPWANKIAINLKGNLADFRNEVISARQVLTLEQPGLDVFVSKSIIWIATKPTLQLDLLEKLFTLK